MVHRDSNPVVLTVHDFLRAVEDVSADLSEFSHDYRVVDSVDGS